MFCPKCATNNVDGASFCRGCGANISLVPQALTGQLMQAPVEEVEEGGRRRGRRRDRGEASLDQAFRNVFMGLAFLIVAIALSRTIGQVFWFWFLLPKLRPIYCEMTLTFSSAMPRSRAMSCRQLAMPPVGV